MFGFLKKLFGTAQTRLVKKYQKVVAEVNFWEEKFQALSEADLKAKTKEFRERFKNGESIDALLPEAYAVVKNACRRLCGTHVHVFGYGQGWDMVPYDVQLIGATAMHYGAIAEMQTGEGKTLTCTLPLYLNALTGKPVHLVTVNDYLVQRDSEWMGAIFSYLGLTVGALVNTVPPHVRKALYACDVVYGTAAEFGFDYLRDNSTASRKEEQVQRGYYFAIVDEIDSILIDEARTPLIISGPVPVSRQMYDELKEGVAVLVRMQRDLCNRLATEARKVLDKGGWFADRTEAMSKREKVQESEEQEAFHKLWLVTKGTPNHRVLKHVRENPDMRDMIDKWDVFYYGEGNRAEKAKALSELFVIVDEKASEFELTDKGIAAWAEHEFGSADDFVMLDLGHEYALVDQEHADIEERKKHKFALQDEDVKRKERAHNLRQLLRAQLMMEKDVDYIVQDNKVIIIDEHTGRPQPGRRFSDGLHQAIEAKEAVAVQKETQTYATITLQNYFRMYKKLAGMSGTAMTEANEFKEIYKLEVVEIPTYRRCVRADANDEIYMTTREKYNAILKEVIDVHAKGRPILIGTESVDISETLSRVFKQNKLPYTILNAKNHAQEAEIIADAGKVGAITIATNMAGRGTDIKLKEGVVDLGGLHVIGTTRHNSRRIDRQLRGRCARLGDPGSSRFYVSFEDTLMRLFASPRLNAMLKKFRPPEGEPISAGILNRAIETAQKRVEQRNYTIRKHTLEYDDVMNKQRQEIYSFRNEIMHIEDVCGMAVELIEGLCETRADEYFRGRGEEAGWNPEGFREWLISHFPLSIGEGYFDDDHSESADLAKKAAVLIIEAFKQKIDYESKKRAPSANAEAGTPILGVADETVRSLMLRKVDQLWQEHLLVMDHLRTEVAMRAVAQKDPLIEFKQEAFVRFDELSQMLRMEIARDLFKFETVTYDEQFFQKMIGQLKLETQRSFLTELERTEPVETVPAEVQESAGVTIVGVQRTGRNDNCPCGSGKKYKKCCGAESEVKNG